MIWDVCSLIDYYPLFNHIGKDFYWVTVSSKTNIYDKWLCNLQRFEKLQLWRGIVTNRKIELINSSHTCYCLYYKTSICYIITTTREQSTEGPIIGREDIAAPIIVFHKVMKTTYHAFLFYSYLNVIEKECYIIIDYISCLTKLNLAIKKICCHE